MISSQYKTRQIPTQYQQNTHCECAAAAKQDILLTFNLNALSLSNCSFPTEEKRFLKASFSLESSIGFSLCTKMKNGTFLAQKFKSYFNLWILPTIFLKQICDFFFSVKRMTFQPSKSESFDDEPLKKPLKTVLMLDYVHYQWRQNLSVRLLLSAMILAREPPIITLDKKMGPSTYLLHSTFPHSMHKKRFE